MTGTKWLKQSHEGAQLTALIPFDDRTTLEPLLREGDQQLRPSNAKGIKSKEVEPLRQKHKEKPSEKQLVRWRKASSKWRQRKDADERVYGLSLSRMLVASALTAIRPDLRDRLTNHKLCVELLTPLVVEALFRVSEEALLRVSDDVTYPNLKLDIDYMLRQVRRCR